MALIKAKDGNNIYTWKSDDIRDAEIKAITEIYSSKNLLENKLTSTSTDGVDLVVNSDKSISASGKNNGTTSVIDLNDKIYLQPGTYILSDGGYGSQFSGYVYIQLMVYGGSMACHTAAGDDNFTVTSESTRYVAQLVISHSYTLNGTFYPMIRDARIKDPTYVPYAMTNKQLTERVNVAYKNEWKGLTFESQQVSKNLMLILAYGITSENILAWSYFTINYSVTAVYVSDSRFTIEVDKIKNTTNISQGEYLSAIFVCYI